MASLAAAEPRAASRSPALSPSRSGGEKRADAAQDTQSRSVDLDHVIALLGDSDSKDFEKEQLKTLKKVVKHFENGFPLKDLAQISEILSLCAEKMYEQEAFTEPLCELIKLFELPFQKRKSSEEMNYSIEASKSIALLGYLMSLPSSQVKIQICKTIVSFYNMDLPGKRLSGYQPTSPNYKIQMAEAGGVAEYFVYSLALVENQLTEKLWVLKALQHLSISETSCGQMVQAQAASRLCLCLNDADPSGQLMFHSSDILWNLLEKTSKEEVVYQLRSLECVHALKEAFVDLMCGFRHCDHQLRNDLLVIATLLAEYPAVPMIESGFAEILIVLATCTEVKLPNPLVKGFKLTYSYEDFEMKKLLFNIIGILSKDPSSTQLLSENHVIPALLYYVKKNRKPGFPDWSAAQYEELQLHAIAVLASVAPVLVDKYLSCQANTLLLVFLEWCVSQDPFFGQGNSFHGTGGRGSKLAQMHYSLRALRSVVALYDDAVSINLCDQGAICQLLDILKYAAEKFKEKESSVLLEIQTDILFILSVLCESDNHKKELFSCEGIGILIAYLQMDPRSLYSGLGHNYLLLSALDCLWSCVIGCYIAEDSFIEKQGIFLLLDLLSLQEKNLGNIILGILVEFSDNAKTILHMNIWQGKRGQTAANVLIQLWRQEEMDLGVKRDQYGKIVGFEHLPGLSAKDVVTLAIIQHFIDFKVGEVWSEIKEEIKEEFRPVTSDERILKLISEVSENTGRKVVALQTEALEKQHRQEIREEKKTYQKIKATNTQREMVNKSWENFLARTSNYEALKKAKMLQGTLIEASRSKIKLPNGPDHPTDIPKLQITVAPGRCVTVGSTSHQGGPLADTDHAPKKSSACKKAFRSDQKR
ncbi:cilia- and flagella-associated protein 69 isoform X2 [Haemorhous mexicanus]|uniref:cilia- and flagella-associated protein 69 isoform X2 n=1 Tax=Haemorhous mexicanus TaxID=30427 RepID=UPI0028BE7CFD|nr:cilia- and flagella-associated protein 69 isoform X2 [Haemorhous mexicanus]